MRIVSKFWCDRMEEVEPSNADLNANDKANQGTDGGNATFELAMSK